MENPIAYIVPGKNYLNPKLEILVDEAADLESKEKLKNNLEHKLQKLITTELIDLVELSQSKLKNSYSRALCFQLYEKNGVMKRESINEVLKNIPKEERINLRRVGIKIGRYHIFLPKMLKPNAVSLRVKLWKLYFPKELEYNIPVSGLNFLKNETKEKGKFMLICGFENFDKFYIRVDILERLFLQIINNTENGLFKIDSNMINLIGCNKENFYKLLELMQYKRKKVNKAKEEFFNYQPKHIKRGKSPVVKKSNKDTPFDKLAELRLR